MIDKYIYRRKKGTNIIIILILLSSFFNIAIPQWDGVGTDTITKTILNVQSANKKEEKKAGSSLPDGEFACYAR